MKENIEILNEVEIELKRFNQKFQEAKQEQSDYNNWSKKKYVSLRRAALDLKNELTKITQDSKYKWEK